MRPLVLIAAFVFALAAGAADAKPCRDAKGHYAKCPPAAAKMACRDAKGHYAKCGSPGASPAMPPKK